MTVDELTKMLEPIDAAQMAAFLQRGQLLTARDGIDSKIRNVEGERGAALLQFQKTIEELQAARADVQAQIDALG